MWLRLLLCSVLLTSARLLPASYAQTPELVSAGPDDIAITVYPDNLAMITETRTVDLPAGRSDIALKGVSDRMIPETALLTEFGAVTIERNFDYNLLTKASLLESAIGQDVTLYRTLPGSGEVMVQHAKILGGSKGVVFETPDGIETFQCSGLPERIELDERLPEFRAEPTLSLTVRAETAGPQTFVIRYLASGFRWKADYVLNLTGRRKASLIGWLTATNDTGISIKDADLSIVSGELSRLDETEAPIIAAANFVANCLPQPRPDRGFNDFNRIWPQSIIVTGSRLERSGFAYIADIADIAAREDLGDYKLYRVPFRTDLDAQQTKQVLFLQKPEVKIEKRYAFDFSDDPDLDIAYEDAEGTLFHAANRYEIDNDRKGLLAEPLPGGAIRLMTARKTGERFFLGGDDIENLPIGQPAIINAGFTSDVIMTSTRTNETRGKNSSIVSFDLEQEFINTSGETVWAEFILPLEPGQTIENASITPRGTAPNAVWRFRLTPGETKPLTFQVAYRD